MMARLTVATVRDLMDAHAKDEISFTRMVELLNEAAERENEPKEVLRTTVDPISPSESFQNFRDLFL